MPKKQHRPYNKSDASLVYPDLMSSGELARLLSPIIKESTVYARFSTGRFPFDTVKIGGRWYCHREDGERLAKEYHGKAQAFLKSRRKTPEDHADK